jgi:hypothetical protein
MDKDIWGGDTDTYTYKIDLPHNIYNIAQSQKLLSLVFN